MGRLKTSAVTSGSSQFVGAPSFSPYRSWAPFRPAAILGYWLSAIRRLNSLYNPLRSLREPHLCPRCVLCALCARPILCARLNAV